MTIELETEVIVALSKGRKIEAIKTLRELRGIGLKEAKETIDAYVEEHQMPISTVQHQGRSGIVTFVIAIVVLYAVFHLFTQ